jgi:hypothetical protein
MPAPPQNNVTPPDSRTPVLNSDNTFTRPIWRWLTRIVSYGVTHLSGALVKNQIIVGTGTNQGSDVASLPATADGQIPIGAVSDGTVEMRTLTAGANVSITDGPHSITISAPGAVTGPAGANTDVQFNDAGVFGGSNNFTFDKVNGIETVTATGSASPVVAKNAAGGALAAQPGNAGENLFLLGMVTNAAGDYIPTSTSAAYLNQIAATTEIDFEVQEGLTPGTAVPFTDGIGVAVQGKLGARISTVEAYQYGGLGTGKPGMALFVDRNDSGGGAAGTVGLQLKDGTEKFIWFRISDGLPVYGTRPIEGGSEAGTPFGTGTVTSVALTEPVEFIVSGSPVTGAGTLTVTKATQAANLVWAGPTTGAAAQPTFRALVAADIPGGTGISQAQVSARVLWGV